MFTKGQCYHAIKLSREISVLLYTDHRYMKIQAEQITKEQKMEQSFPNQSVHEILVWRWRFDSPFGLGFAYGPEMWYSGSDWQDRCL